MKKIALLLLVIAFPAMARDTYVQGYLRKDGTYVQPHYRSAPDSNPYNNYTTQGNTNPYTGQEGTRDPYQIQQQYATPTLAPMPTLAPPPVYQPSGGNTRGNSYIHY